MRSVVDRNVVMRRIPVFTKYSSFLKCVFSHLLSLCTVGDSERVWSNDGRILTIRTQSIRGEGGLFSYTVHRSHTE